MGLVPPLLIRPRRESIGPKSEHPSYFQRPDPLIYRVCERCMNLKQDLPNTDIEPFYEIARGHRCFFPPERSCIASPGKRFIPGGFGSDVPDPLHTGWEGGIGSPQN